MAKQNIDFEVALGTHAEDAPATALSLKAGSFVSIRYAACCNPPPEAAPPVQKQQQGQEEPSSEAQGQAPSEHQTSSSSRVCMDISCQRVLGPVPEVARKRLASLGQDLQGSIRSIKRDEAGRPTLLLVRVQAVNGQPVAHVKTPASNSESQQQSHTAHAAEYEVDMDGFQLRRPQLEEIVRSEDLRVTLKDERLQRLLSEIESSSNREKALETALQGPAFQEFADKLLTLMDATPRRDVEAPVAAPAALCLGQST